MNNIILIGMPGSGKTTTGKELAEKMNKDFIDTDDILLANCGKPLSQLANEKGREYFLKFQEEMILKYNFNNMIVATGGAVVLTDILMKKLQSIGKVFFLKTSYETLESRMDNSRTLARNQGKSFKDVFEERQFLYEKYANHTILCDGKTVEQVGEEIIRIEREVK